MHLRYCFIAAGLAALTACAPQVPNSGRGVGFENTIDAQRARDSALQSTDPRISQTVLPPDGGTGALPPLTGFEPPAGSAAATAAETRRVLAETRPANAGAAPEGVRLAPVETSQTAPLTNSAGISTENNFDAVAGQRSIEGDAARLEQNRAQYQVIEPRALPQRSQSDQPNIVAFALSTSHPVGTSVYARAGLNGAGRAARNCAQYTSPDLAQIDFLARGGPLRDRRGLDPDGDGYACSWNPAPFRKAKQG